LQIEFKEERFNLNVHKVYSILTVKQQIYEKTQIPFFRQMLSLEGLHLRDENVLKFYEIDANKILQLSEK